MTVRGDHERPSLSLVHDDDVLLQRLADRETPTDGYDDDAARLLAGWTSLIDEDLPADLRPEEPWEAPSRRTLFVTRAGVAASIAAVVVSGGAVAAAATEGGLAGFVHRAERAVEIGVAAPRPAEPVVVVSGTPSAASSPSASTDSARTALSLAKERLAAGDEVGAGAIVDLVQDQVRHDPQSVDAGTRSLLADVQQQLHSRPQGPATTDLAAGRPGRSASPTGTTSGAAPSTPSSSSASAPGSGSSVVAAGPDARRSTPARHQPGDGTPSHAAQDPQNRSSRKTPAPAPTTPGPATGQPTQAPTSPSRTPSPTDVPTPTGRTTPTDVPSTGLPTDPAPTASPTATRSGWTSPHRRRPKTRTRTPQPLAPVPTVTVPASGQQP